MRKIKGISYNEEMDRELIKHINEQQNGSKYILDLVRKDLETGNIQGFIKEQIDSYFKEIADKVKYPHRVE